MPVIPHALWFFDSFSLLLRSDATSFSVSGTGWEMTPQEACRHIDAVAEFAGGETRDGASGLGTFPEPLLVSLLGAEPLADPERLDVVLDCLRRHHLPAEVHTTASWVQSEAQAHETLSRLRDVVFAVRLATTATALDTARLSQVEALMLAARSAGVLVDVHCGVTPAMPFARQLLTLEVVNTGTSFVRVEPAYDQLRADLGAETSGAPQPDFYAPAPTRQRCAERFGFVVAPGGAVFPCLAGAGYEELRIGSLATETVAQIVGRVRADPEMVALRDHGPAGLRAGATDPAASGRPGRYADNCDYHRRLLREPATTGAGG